MVEYDYIEQYFEVLWMKSYNNAILSSARHNHSNALLEVNDVPLSFMKNSCLCCRRRQEGGRNEKRKIIQKKKKKKTGPANSGYMQNAWQKNKHWIPKKEPNSFVVWQLSWR